MTVTKILEQTLSAGSTSVSFTDADIPNSLIRVYSSNSDLIPVSRSLSGNTLTVTYEAQLSAIDVAVEIVKAGLDIIDNLTSTDADKALSAKQGKTLKDDLDTLSGNVDTLSDNLVTLTGRVDNLDIPDNITDLNDVDVNNIANGQVLAWNSTTEKFENVNQSGGGSADISYSTTEKEIGKWLDTYRLYQKTFDLGSDVTLTANAWNAISAIGMSANNISKIVYGASQSNTSEFVGSLNYSGNTNDMLYIFNTRQATQNVRYITLQYTKIVD